MPHLDAGGSCDDAPPSDTVSTPSCVGRQRSNLDETMSFKRTAPGQKTARMLQVEARLGRTLEEDYHDLYMGRNWGQRRLARHWGVGVNVVFYSRKRNRSRCWVDMLSLPRRVSEHPSVPSLPARPACDSCSENTVPLERAHWLEARERGPASPENILLLCPNCHTRLDRQQDPALIERLRAILLHRAASKALAKSCSPGHLLALCRQILTARTTALQPGGEPCPSVVPHIENRK